MIFPLGHRLLVKPVKIEEVDRQFASAKALGIELPALSARQEQVAVDRGMVIAIGSTAFHDFGGVPWCNIGDEVAYTRFGGKLLKDPETDEEFIVLNDEDIIARYGVKETVDV